MATLRKSPFKVNAVENDPSAFGLRYQEIIASSEALYNNRNVLISGSRGIGKSSLGAQLQIALEGDTTLLERCGITTKFPKTLCLFYACDPAITLEQLVLDILYLLEHQVLLLEQTLTQKIKPSIEVNLGVIKAKIEAEISLGKRSPSTLATELVASLQLVLNRLKRIKLMKGINIMLDELDQLPNEINFGHFMKVVHETLNNSRLPEVTFIFAGQTGIYSRLINEDESFERIVRHIPLKTLDGDASGHVLNFASVHATPSFSIEERAKKLILALASGFPYVLHFLGDAAFLEMEVDHIMRHGDVINGIAKVLQSDKREKYFSRFRSLTEDERGLVITLSSFTPEKLPAEIPFEWLSRKIDPILDNPSDLDSTLASLVEKGHLMLKYEQSYCMFSEELFRVFIGLLRIEKREIELRIEEKSPKAKAVKRQREGEELIRMIRYGDIDELNIADLSDIDQLSKEDRMRIYSEIQDHLSGLTYTTAWENDEIIEIYDDDHLDAEQ